MLILKPAEEKAGLIKLIICHRDTGVGSYIRGQPTEVRKRGGRIKRSADADEDDELTVSMSLDQRP